jgi:plastocyanin
MASTYNVSITGMKYVEQSIQIAAGDTVVWTNKDPMAHTAVGDSGEFNSGVIKHNNTFSKTFDAAAAKPITYHCSIHPGMTGTITVT